MGNCKLSELTKLVGMHALFECKRDGDTRVYLHRCSKAESAKTDNGKRDILAVSSNKHQKGFYLDRIDDVKADAHGNIIMTVGEGVFLGQMVDEESVAFDYLQYAGVIPDQMKLGQPKRFNINALHALVSAKMLDLYGDNEDIAAVHMLLDGKMKFAKMEHALEEKTRYELLLDQVVSNTVKCQSMFPIATKMIVKLVKNGKHEKALCLIRNTLFEADSLHLKHCKGDLAKMDAVLRIKSHRMSA
jgi:hypothetical protein